MRLIKRAEKGLTLAAGGLHDIIQSVNKYKPNPSFTPKWSNKPLLKSWQKSKPTLGWPRTTDSLCPNCVIEARESIISGKQDVSVLINEKVGEIKAQIIERDGEVWMVKDCPIHGHFEDMMAIDVKFLTHIEKMFPGRDIDAHDDEKLHNHGSSTIKYGRGAVLTVDLTNRCNMMCDPCFMDANQVGFVHELSMEDVSEILDNAISIKPRRQMSVQFSGGEPTLSPYFLDAVRYARKVGYQSVQAATNGIDIVPVTTIVNGINNEQVGRIIQFALDNPKKIPFCSFQPVSFTGRDEAVTDERRTAQRYTLSHLAHDVKNQTGLGEPVRDWFPISFMSTFSDFADHVHGPSADWGQLSCGCHPNCGIGMAVMVDKHTKEGAPVTSFLNADRLAKDIAKVNDAGRGKFLSITG